MYIKEGKEKKQKDDDFPTNFKFFIVGIAVGLILFMLTDNKNTN